MAHHFSTTLTPLPPPLAPLPVWIRFCCSPRSPTSDIMRANTILETIGNTPHVRINRLYAGIGHGGEVWLKLERNNPGASIKDRIGIAMIEDAEKRGVLKKGCVIDEPTSGNTGIGLAIAAADKGHHINHVLPLGRYGHL